MRLMKPSLIYDHVNMPEVFLTDGLMCYLYTVSGV